MQWHKADPTSRRIYVTDTETDQIVGGTQRNVFDKDPYVEPSPPMAASWIEEGHLYIFYFEFSTLRIRNDTAFRIIADSVLNNFLAGRPHRMNRPHMRKSTLTEMFILSLFGY